MLWNEIILVSIKTTSGEVKEIIEVGLCKFNTKTFKRSDSVSVFVRPLYSKITGYCTNITGVSQSDVADAISFYDLCDFMEEVYNTKNLPWASYGNFADVVFNKQCYEYNIANPFSDRYVNIRHLYSLFMSRSTEVSLSEALNDLNIPIGSNTCEDEVLNLGILFAEILRR